MDDPQRLKTTSPSTLEPRSSRRAQGVEAAMRRRRRRSSSAVRTSRLRLQKALEKKELDEEETGLTPEAKARYEMLRRRKRAKERVRRAEEKMKRLQATRVT